MKNRSLSLSLLILFPFLLLGQRASLSDLRPLSEVEQLKLPPLDNSLLKNQNQTKSQALRFAEQRAVDVSLKQNGTREYVKNGKMVWRQRISSPNAYSINLGFTQFKLSQGVEMYIYNLDQSDVVGPLTAKDNDDHMQLWTPLIKGDQIVIELNGDAKAIEKSTIVLSSVNHDFIDIQNKSLSGSCNLDVACGNEDGWEIVDNYRDIISSVGAYTLNGIDQCTGMLINNTSNDCRPYFITADHCEISLSNAQTVVVYWNFENQTCRQPFSFESGQAGNGLRNDFNSGAKLRATLPDSDFALIELDDPIDPKLNLFFSGWDLSGQLSDTSICVHHPAVEEKRISFDFESMIYESGNAQTPYVRVLDWDIGTTEPGSSGAPIFNRQKRFIGQLNGGLAACGNDQYDAFGYINYSWDANSLPSKSLKSWLDPMSKGVEYLDGIKCSFNLGLSESEVELCGTDTDQVTINIMPSTFFEGEITYVIDEIPNLLMASFEFEKGTKNEENILTIDGFTALAEGEYSIVISASDDNNTAEETIKFNVTSSLPNAPTPSAPLDGEGGFSSSVTLELKRGTINNNEFQVALDSNFNEVAYQELIKDRFYNVTNLKGNKIYFWRARAVNVCGASEWTETRSFMTAPSFCSRFYYQGQPIEIPTNASEVIRSSINIDYPIRIQDVNIPNITGTHSFLEDLVFSLSFNSEDIPLTREICGELDDFNFGFDDESSLRNIECPPTNGKIYKPTGLLGSYIDKIAGGRWDLLIEDLADFDGGYLDDWSIEVCFNESEAAVIVPEFHLISYCEDQIISLNCFFNTKGIDDYKIDVTDRNGISILNQYYLNQNETDEVILEIDSEKLTGQQNNIQIILRNALNDELLAFSKVLLVNEGVEQAIKIISPSDGQMFLIDEEVNIIWDTVSDGESHLEIALDSFFQSVIYAQAVNQKDNLVLPPGIIDPGSYYVRIKSVYDCGTVFSSAVKFIVDDDTNIINNPLQSIKVYPNPSNGQFYIRRQNSFEPETTLELYDIAGRYYKPELIYINSGLVIMNLNDFNNGLYFLKIRKGDSVIQEKIYKIE